MEGGGWKEGEGKRRREGGRGKKGEGKKGDGRRIREGERGEEGEGRRGKDGGHDDWKKIFLG